MHTPSLLSILRQQPLLRSRAVCLRTQRVARAPRTTAFRPTGSRCYSDVSQQTPSGERDRSAVGVFTPKAALLFVMAGAGLFMYFRHEKEKLLEAKQKELESRQYGRAHVGGPFSLMTHKGEPFTEKDMLGKWTLVYFGFTNCPDICPAELDKMTAIVKKIESTYGPILHPLFISVDPARDSPSQISKYLTDFHPRFIGLTGSYDDVKATCKQYRVYFSTPPGTKPGDDYLVDHSIFVYLMDPEGQFVDAFGQVSTVEDVVNRFEKEVGEWEREKGRKV